MCDKIRCTMPALVLMTAFATYASAQDLSGSDRGLLRQHIPFGTAGGGPFVVREGYVLSYNNAHRMPAWVAYRVAPGRLRDVEMELGTLRDDPDVQAPPSDRDWPTGFDPVQLAPSSVMGRDNEELERAASKDANYMGNMVFLHESGLGASDGMWQRLQDWIQGDLVANQQLEVGVIAGCLPLDPGPHPPVPGLVFCVVYTIEGGELGGAVAFLLPQQWRQPGRMRDFIVSLDIIEGLTGLQLFSELDGAGREWLDWPYSLPWDADQPEAMMFGARSFESAANGDDNGGGDDRQPYVIVPVYYGTNRNLLKPDNDGGLTDHDLISECYGPADAHRLERGVCQVSVPNLRNPGEVKLAPWWASHAERRDREKFFVFTGLEVLDEQLFRARIRKEPGEQLFVYVHGFNNSFADAAYRAAQMAVDLKVNCTAAMYAWPSQGKGDPGSYRADEAAVESAIAHLKAFLVEIVAGTEPKQIHLIAHSMGTRLLSKTLADMAKAGADLPRINQIILAAPDIDAKAFVEEIAPKIERFGNRITIYQSQRDQALYFSQAFVHATGVPRLGIGPVDLSQLPASDKFEQVNATWVDTSTLGHMYFGNDHRVLDDVSRVLTNSGPLQRRLVRSYIIPGQITPWQPEVVPRPWYWRLKSIGIVCGIVIVLLVILAVVLHRLSRRGHKLRPHGGA